MSIDWTNALDPEDLQFVKRFVLASGSLKEVARAYGVSYPTLRARLDRLIAKIQVAERLQEAGPMERSLRALFAAGDLDEKTFNTLLNSYRREKTDADPR